MVETLPTNLAESILTLLATNNEQGKVAAGLLKPEHFDDTYRDIATRILKFHRKQGKAPGKEHLSDLFDDVLVKAKPKRRKQYLLVLDGILHQAPGLNAAYVLSRVSNFTRLQNLKAAWFESADVIERGEDDAVAEVERIWYRSLRNKDSGVTHGIFLNETAKSLEFLDHQEEHYNSGIPAFDRVGLSPTPGTMLLFMSPYNKGKSWWATHNGKMCLMQNANVLHCTNEMSALQTIQRYYQSWFALPKRKEKYDITRFEFDDLKRLTAFKSSVIKPRMSLNDRGIREYLVDKMEPWGVKFRRLHVVEFAPGILTVPRLESYIEYLELIHKWIPNVLIVDSPDNMAMPGDDLRIAMGRTYIDLRGLFVRRNLAGVVTTQGNRKSWDATTVKSSMVSEDASKFMTADMGIIYSQTKSEEEKKLARLYNDRNRHDEKGFEVVISQNYNAGQFVLDSARMQKTYWSLVEGKKE